jgi:hypothetical protein
MDSNLLHGPSVENKWHSTRKVLETNVVLMIPGGSHFS